LYATQSVAISFFFFNFRQIRSPRIFILFFHFKKKWLEEFLKKELKIDLVILGVIWEKYKSKYNLNIFFNLLS